MQFELYVCGLNHKTSTLATRERATIAPEQQIQLIQTFKSETGASEAVMLMTCNRCEWYWVGADPEQVDKWLQKHYGFEQQWQTIRYLKEEYNALSHIMHVASGLDSMMIGEPQILGQLKAAVNQAQLANTLGKQLQHIFSTVFSTAKKIRTQTSLGSKPTSVAFAAASLAKCIFTDLSALTVLLIGAGETIELVAKHFHKLGIKHFISANRTLSHAQALVAPFQGQAVALTDIASVLPSADIVVTATASTQPLIYKADIQTAMRGRRRPLHLIDLAVPRNIEADINKIDSVFLYNLDDLQKLVAQAQNLQTDAIKQAEQIIREQISAFKIHLCQRQANPAIRSYRGKIEQVRDTELEKALRLLENGISPEEVLIRFANALTNKFLHEPTSLIKSASQQSSSDLTTMIRRWLTATSTENV